MRKAQAAGQRKFFGRYVRVIVIDSVPAPFIDRIDPHGLGISDIGTVVQVHEPVRTPPKPKLSGRERYLRRIGR